MRRLSIGHALVYAIVTARRVSLIRRWTGISRGTDAGALGARTRRIALHNDAHAPSNSNRRSRTSLTAVAAPHRVRSRHRAARAQTPGAAAGHAAAGHRDRAEGARRPAEAAGQRDGRAAATSLWNAGMTTIGDAAIYAPNTYFTRVHRAQAEQPALPRHRLQPGQPGDHHLHRRRAAAQRQFLEHRAARRRAGRVRPRPAERAVRPQHARRSGQRHQRAAVARPVDRLRARSRSATSTRVDVRASASGPIGRAGSASASRSVTRGATASRRNDVTGNDLDFRDGALRQGAAAADAGRATGKRGSSSPASAPATATTRSAISRRCAPIRSTPRATSRGTPIATSTPTTFAGAPRGRSVALHVDDRVRALEDRRPHRSGLHAAAAR